MGCSVVSNTNCFETITSYFRNTFDAPSLTAMSNSISMLRKSYSIHLYSVQADGFADFGVSEDFARFDELTGIGDRRTAFTFDRFGNVRVPMQNFRSPGIHIAVMDLDSGVPHVECDMRGLLRKTPGLDALEQA